jgi:DNA mismatch endonuclease, patch repair protein
MPDVFPAAVRSRMMAGIRAKDTKPEMLVRKGLHAMGFRYRLHDRKLPGKPDLVFPKYRAVIFVNGCFWHGHECPAFRWPKSRDEFWREKIGRNRANDILNREKLEVLGWRHFTVWECSLRKQSDKAKSRTFSICKKWLEEKLAIPEVGVI